MKQQIKAQALILCMIFLCMGNAFSLRPFSFLKAADRLSYLPGLGAISDVELAGYLPLVGPDCIKDHCASNTGNLFYWFVESRTKSKDAPLVLWLNGGPGAASLYGFFMENGPYSVSTDGRLTKRKFSWTEKAHYLMIDQPAGVGFSYGTATTYANEAEAMAQLYHALTLFFQRHPELAAKDLYLAGQSYAGKYLPQLAIRILAGNTAGEKIHLKGLLIGDGWVNPRLQQRANMEMAYSHGLIDRTTRKKVEALYQQCTQEIDKATPSSRQANQVCSKIQDLIRKVSGDLNLANIATDKELDDSAMIQYLNSPEVRKALHVDPRIKKFKSFSKMASDLLEIGEQDSVAPLYPQLLAAGVRVLIYNGLEDAKDSNFISADLWLEALNWPGKKQFANAPTCVWRTAGQVAGYAKAAEGLTQVKIRGAGHIAPADQPERLLDLLHRFINNQSFCG
ncbi:Carboxypeptidase [Legionella fallonii LLAP-10]|uniref:Carboxypeptidase n=2 Tax=Legionella fallonii TaxID=96230 RepID=A0A098G0M8_9GAMM|nr:Carboxypeptidase [Legionella fallonii LLAP-10]